jgi:hypothetical protein
MFGMIQKRIVWVGYANIEGRCNDIDRQNLSANIRGKRPLMFYYDMKFEWVSKAYTFYCTRNERSRLACFKAGTWKLRGVRNDLRKEHALYAEEKNAFYRPILLLKCLETRKQRKLVFLV